MEYRAYRVGPRKPDHERNPRGVLIRFPDWHMKLAVIEAFEENSDCVIGNSKISLLSDLSIITLHKRWNLKFLTSVLQQEEIRYQRGFPFKLILDYNQKKITIRKLQEAERLGSSADINESLQVKELKSHRESLMLHHNT